MKITSLLLAVILVPSTIQAKEIVNNWKFVEVIDGDTIKFEVPYMPSELKYISIRTMGLDTPEHHSKCAAEVARANAATAYLKSKINPTDNITVEIDKWDKYGGRVDGLVLVNGVDISSDLIAKGYARPYHGENKATLPHWPGC